jgi:transposase-like protein
MRNKYLKRARVLERDLRAGLRCFAHDVPALTAAKMCGVNKNTAHRLYTLLRERVVALAQAEARPFVGGIVEVDESYFGPRRVRGKRGRGAGRKIPVIGLLKREGKVFAQIVPNCSKSELLRVIHGQVKGAATIHTDGWKAYDGLVLDGFKHDRVHPHENEFARGKRHINGIESFWGFAKTRLAKQRGVRPDKFPFHLKESEWRWNHRLDNLYSLLLKNTRSHPLN